MAVYKVQAPDGHTIQLEGPDGASEADILAQAQRLYTPQQQKNTYDPTEGMSGLDKFEAGAGKAVYDFGRGGGQVLRQVLGDKWADRLGLPTQKDIDESRQLDEPLMKTGAGKAGNIVGGAAVLAPTAMIPGANTYLGASLVGAGAGALAPTATGESRYVNTLTGGAAGAIGLGVGRGISRALHPVRATVSPETADLAVEAGNAGIPLRASQMTGSKPLALTESVLEKLPFTSEREAAQRATQQAAFNSAVLAKAGINAAKATPEVLAKQKQSLGNTFKAIAGRNVVNFNAPNPSLGGKPLVDTLADITADAETHLTPKAAKDVASIVDGVLGQVDPKSGAMLGTNYQGWREPLRHLSKANDAPAHWMGQIRKALDTAFADQVTGQDAHLWRQASQQYGNLKTIADAMGQAGAASKAGNISPAALEGAFTKQITREGKALGRGDLNKLVGVGRTFVSENLPDSGTAQRDFYTRLLTGQVAGAVPGAAVGYQQGGPEGAFEGALLGAAGGMATPRLVQSLLNSRAGQAYLTKGAAPLTAAARKAIANALRTGATATALEQINE